MIKLGINEDLETWTEFFLTDQNVQLVVNRYDNKK